MTQQIPNYDEEIVGANHPTKSDTVNRGFLINHDSEGNHKYCVFPEESSDPTTAANQMALYIKESGSISELFLRRESNGAVIYLSTGFRLHQRTIYTSSDTWTKAAWCRAVWVQVVGGGGGSGGVGNATGQGVSGGGGGGGYSEKIILSASLGATETVTVGAAGAAGASGANAGGNGGTSSFGAHCSATGGTGGVAGTCTTGNSVSTGVSGGSGSGGDLNIDGGTSHMARVLSGVYAIVSAGGKSFLSGTQGINKTAGLLYGGGAGGSVASSSAESGSAGAAGVVIVWEFE